MFSDPTVAAYVARWIGNVSFDLAGYAAFAITLWFMLWIVLRVPMASRKIREATGERIRDKIAASKKKGMWMGGTIPLGYDVKDRRLVVNPGEAETVRSIMTRYVELGSVPALVTELAAKGIVSKRRVDRNGRVTGGTSYRRGALYDLLANRLYLGEVVHKGVAHPGEHDAIVDQALWDQVQRLLASNRVTRRHQGNANDPSLLAGMIRDSQGRRMSPRHAGKANRRYRYYVSVTGDGGATSSTAPVMRIAAGEIEASIVSGLAALLNNPAALIASLAIGGNTAASVEGLQRSAPTFAAEIELIPPAAMHELLAALDLRVIIDGGDAAATVNRELLATQLGITLQNGSGNRCSIAMPKRLQRTGNEARLAIAPQSAGAPTSRDGSLVALIVKAHQARDLLVGQGAQTDAALTMSDRHLTRLARLTYLAPEIIVAILEGRQPKFMTSRSLLRVSSIPLDWHEQRKMFGT